MNTESDIDVLTSASVECTLCGESIDASKWHLVETVENETGQTMILTFCSEQCRDQWTR